MTDRFASMDAAYVLGALSPDEHREYEAHLAECERCASAVAELSGMPALLSEVLVEDVPVEGPVTEAPPKTLLPTLLRRVRRARVRRRLTIGAAGAVAVAACLLALMVVLVPGDPGEPPPQASTVQIDRVVNGPISASARLVDRAWGTEIDVSCGYDGGAALGYTLAVRDRRGRVEQVASWRAQPGVEATFTAATAMRIPQIDSLEIRTDSGRTVLRLAPE